MTQEEKDLLLKDLCGRLLYGIKFGIGLGKLGKYDLVEINTKKGKVLFGHGLHTDLETCRPYLRPMSSMTKEEKNEYTDIKKGECNGCVLTGKGDPDTEFLLVDWLNSHHFDYRGLIEKGLALEAPEGMYY